MLSSNQWQQIIMICHLNNHQLFDLLFFVSLTWDSTWHHSEFMLLMTYMLGCWSRGLVISQAFRVLAWRHFFVSRTRNLSLVSFAVSSKWQTAPNFQFHFQQLSFDLIFLITTPVTSEFVFCRSDRIPNVFLRVIYYEVIKIVSRYGRRESLLIVSLTFNRERTKSSFDPCG